MAKKKESDQKTKEQQEAFREFLQRQYDLRPLALDPNNPTKEESDADFKWRAQMVRELIELEDSGLTHQQLEEKYKRSPEVEQELQDLDKQLEAVIHLKVKAAEAGSEENLFRAETEFHELYHKKLSVMENRGSLADKQRAEELKAALRSIKGQFEN